MLAEATRDGGGRACLIVGPPGIGKSRLARELMQRLDRTQLACIEANADADGFAPAFWPWLQALASGSSSEGSHGMPSWTCWRRTV